MNSRRIYLLIIAVLFTLSFGSVFAQEATEPAEGMVSCDSDLILSLYIAERFFGFSSFNDEMSGDMMLDLDTIDRGQYSTMFDELDGSTVVEISDETRTSISDMMMMDDATFDAQMGETSLSEGVVEESTECAALRASLRRFFMAIAMSDVSMESAGGAGTGTDTGSSGDTGSDTGSDTGTGQEGVIVVALSGATEVPGPGDEDASGTATVYLRGASNEVCVDISVQNITLPATAAHIHQAPAGESGPPVVPLNAPNENGVSNTCATVDAALMQEMINNPQNFYVNVHNADFPDGAARGQLTDTAASGGGDTGSETGSSDDSGDDSDDGDTSGDTEQEGVIAVTLSGATEVPGPGDEDASGTATVYLRSSTNEVCVDLIVENITLPATAAHIHQAPAGESGPPVVPLNAPNENGVSNTCATVDAALMQEMVNNPQNFYVNVHNADFPDGAARGQLQ
jgi:hypothetical protein